MPRDKFHLVLVHAVTAYDRKQSTRRGYNIYALAQYLQRINDVEADIYDDNKDMRAALVDGFTGRLLDVALKALGLSQSNRAEQMSNHYVYCRKGGE